MEPTAATDSDSPAPIHHIVDTTLSTASLASDVEHSKPSTDLSDHEETASGTRTSEGKDLARPRLGNRQSSGTMIVPADRKSNSPPRFCDFDRVIRNREILAKSHEDSIRPNKLFCSKYASFASSRISHHLMSYRTYRTETD